MKRNHGDRVKYHLLQLEKETASNEDNKERENSHEKYQTDIINRKKFN